MGTRSWELGTAEAEASSDWASATIEDGLYIWDAYKGGSVRSCTWYTWVAAMFNIMLNPWPGSRGSPGVIFVLKYLCSRVDFLFVVVVLAFWCAS